MRVRILQEHFKDELVPWSPKHGIPIVAHCLNISPKPEMRSNPDLKGHGGVSSIDIVPDFSHQGPPTPGRN